MKSEHHPNGFTKIILGSIFGYRIRVHYWPKSEQKYKSRHNHRWSFTSAPLLGAFVDKRFEEIPGNKTMRISVSDSDGLRDSARKYSLEGTSGLRLKAEYIRYPLIPYLCHLGEIHAYYPKGNGRHLSLVIISPLKTESSEIWRDPEELDVEIDT
jgi:hypothetical protein